MVLRHLITVVKQSEGRNVRQFNYLLNWRDLLSSNRNSIQIEVEVLEQSTRWLVPCDWHKLNRVNFFWVWKYNFGKSFHLLTFCLSGNLILVCCLLFTFEHRSLQTVWMLVMLSGMNLNWASSFCIRGTSFHLDGINLIKNCFLQQTFQALQLSGISP